MPTASPRPLPGKHRRVRVLGVALLVCLVWLAVLIVQQDYRARASAQVQEAEAARRESPHPQLSAQEARRTIILAGRHYLRAVAARDYASALQVTFAPFRLAHTPRSLGVLMEHGYVPLLRARHPTIAATEIHADRGLAMLAITLPCSDTTRRALLYRTVFVFVPEGRTWKLSGISPPRPLLAANELMPKKN